MKVYSRYTPYLSKVDALYHSLNKIYTLMNIPYEIKVSDSKNTDCKVITVIYDTADVMNFIETHNNYPGGRKPSPLPAREELFCELNQGMSKKELAEKYGVSRPTLYKRLGLNKKE